MKKIFILLLSIPILFSQSGQKSEKISNKYEFLLKNDDNLKLVGENYQIIKTELSKMLKDYLSQVDLDLYWKEKYTVNISTGSERIDEAVYYQWLAYYKDSYPLDWAKAEAKRLATYSPSKPITKGRNREIEIGETLSSKSVEWSDIISYFGGYSEISKIGFSKKDVSKFDIKVVLDKIELTGSSTCLAHVKIIGDEEYGFKYHKIPKSVYKYEGTYNFLLKKDYLALFRGVEIAMRFNFEKKGYFTDKQKYYKRLDNSLLPSNKNFVEVTRTMIDDLADNNLDKNIQAQYHRQCDIRFSDDVQMMINSYEEEFKKFINDNPKAMKYVAKIYKKQFKKKLKENDINLFYSLMNTVAVNMDSDKAANPPYRIFLNTNVMGGLSATDWFGSSNVTGPWRNPLGAFTSSPPNIEEILFIKDDWLISNYIVSKGVSEYKINDYKPISPSKMIWYQFFLKGQKNNPSFGKSFNENLIRWSHYVHINTLKHNHNFFMDYQWITNREMPKGISEYEGYIPKRYYHEYKPYLLNESILNSDFENARKKHCNLFIGIGIRVDERRKIITYVNENSPAKRAGIRRGDKIEYIDGKSTFKMDNLLVQLRGSGELGSKIELHISKQSRYKPTSFILNRELIFN